MKRFIAKSLAEKFLYEYLDMCRVDIVGSLCRGEEEVGDIDIITNKPLDFLKDDIEGSIDKKCKFVAGGNAKIDVDFHGIRINIYYCEPKYWGAMRFMLVGPQQYVIAYRRRAKDRGMKLNQYGLWKGDKLIASRTEEEIYKALGKNYKPPEERGK